MTGNIDAGLCLDYKETELVELAGRKFLIQHIVDAHSPVAALQRRIIRDNPDAVIFGHSHRPFSEQINGRLYLNPGYAGKSRFGLARSVAILSCEDQTLKPEFKYLD